MRNFAAATSAFTPTLFSVYSSSETRYAGLMVTRIRPALAAANWVSAHSALFGDQMPIRSPRSSPSAINPAASASAFAFSSPNVQRTPCNDGHDRLDIAPAAGRLVQRLADGVFPQRRRLRPFDVTELGVHRDRPPTEIGDTYDFQPRRTSHRRLQ